jgi:hypothetical protein
MNERAQIDRDDAAKEWADAYRRGAAAATETGVRADGAVEANAAIAAARAWQRRLTNEELEQFWAPTEWGALYEPPSRRRRS